MNSVVAHGDATINVGQSVRLSWTVYATDAAYDRLQLMKKQVRNKKS